MPPKNKYINCTCPLFPEAHQVRRDLLQSHREDLERRDSLVRETTKAVLSDATRSDAQDHDPDTPDDDRDIKMEVMTEAMKSLTLIMTQRTERPKQPTRQTQNDNLLQRILREIETAIFSVQAASTESHDTEFQSRTCKEAYAAVSLAADSLKSFQDSEEKSLVVKSLEYLDGIVKDLRETLPEDTGPVFYNSAHIGRDPIGHLEELAQVVILLGLVCHSVLNIPGDYVNLILGSAQLLIEGTMALNPDKDARGRPKFDAVQERVLDQLPSSLYTAMSRMNLDSKTTLYATCPSCHEIHAPTLSASRDPTWPAKCDNMIVGKEGRVACGTNLLKQGKGASRPIRPFLSPCFLDYIARLLTNPETEKMLDEACDVTALEETDFVKDIFQAEFLREFKDRDGVELFIKRPGKRMRLAFAISMDFFPVFGSRKRSNSNSIGLLYLYCLNLPLINVRHAPENVYVAIIPGPSAPKLDRMNPFLRTIIDPALQGWERGIHFSSTASEPTSGRIADLAIVMSNNDLPAARQLAGAASHSAHIYCTCCECRGRSTVYNTDFETWVKRNKDETRAQAEAWRDADTTAEREAIFQQHGVRWSEMWRLPYWDPSRCLVADPMHTVFERWVHYYCRDVLQINLADAKNTKTPPAYQYPFANLDTVVPQVALTEKNEKVVLSIYKLLVRQLVPPTPEDGPGEDFESDHDDDDDDAADDEGNNNRAGNEPVVDDSLTPERLAHLLSKKAKPSLRFVCWTLELPKIIPSDLPERKPRKGSKKSKPSKPSKPMMDTDKPFTRAEYLDKVGRDHLADLLVEWRLNKPFRTNDQSVPTKTIDLLAFQFIQEVIRDTTTPSWINHVPKNYGEKGAGTLKADEWRLLATIYLPIAMVILWADMFDRPDLLRHCMALCQAVTIVCRFGTSSERSSVFRDFVKAWVEKLYELHPHTSFHSKRTSIHMAFHLFDFMHLFGPVPGWWDFPTEQLIGILQKINSNSHVGGEHEVTVAQTWIRSANLKRWFNRKDCPELIAQFHRLYDMFVAHRSEPRKDSGPLPSNKDEKAHHNYAGMHFSRASTHLGNSLVSFADANNRAVFGSIDQIKVLDPQAGKVQFNIRTQEPLPKNSRDPFLPFPHFPARTYSSNMSKSTVAVDPSQVIGHYARFKFSGERAVVLDLSRF